MGTIAVDLASRYADVWAELFESDFDAESILSGVKEGIASITTSVGMAVDAAKERERETDMWLELTKADLALLSGQRTGRVVERYRRALAHAPPYRLEAALTQVYILSDLGVLKESVDTVIAAFGTGQRYESPKTPPATSRALLFVGHAIDAPNRPAPRFPAAAEPQAREAILRAVREEVGENKTAFIGVAGASSGGDILFHEVCETIEIDNRICLALPPTKYSEIGVTSAGPQWEARFRALIARHSCQVLSESPELPAWLRPNAPYDFWRRYTLRRFCTALAVGQITVIALWDGKEGSAADLVRTAKERGAKVVVLDANRLPA